MVCQGTGDPQTFPPVLPAHQRLEEALSSTAQRNGTSAGAEVGIGNSGRKNDLP